VFQVEDAFLPENAGRWRLTGGKAERTDDAADLALDVGELGAAYLGGFTFGELVRAGAVRELKEGGAARADAVFRTDAPKPWCPEIF
jgi:predicted acetyltransferase